MIDLHTHILPGVDDGAATMEDSLEMARTASADGITAVAATPHVRDDYPTSAGTMERLVRQLGQALTRSGIPLEVRPGGELALDRLAALGGAELTRFGLGGNPAYLLVEFPYYGWSLALESAILRLRSQGVTPVLAHPERNAEVQARPARLEALVQAGALVQVTAASLDGRIGKRARAAGFELLERGTAHMIASDAHTPEVRGIGMSAAAAAVGDDALARWLTDDVPAAILAGNPIPERPAPRRRSFFRR